MPFDDVVQGGFQFVAGLAVGVGVVSIGDLCEQSASRHDEHEQQGWTKVMMCHSSVSVSIKPQR